MFRFYVLNNKYLKFVYNNGSVKYIYKDPTYSNSFLICMTREFWTSGTLLQATGISVLISIIPLYSTKTFHTGVNPHRPLTEKL